MNKLSYIGHDTPKSFYSMLCLLVAFAQQKSNNGDMEFLFQYNSKSNFKFTITGDRDDQIALAFEVCRYSDNVLVKLLRNNKLILKVNERGLFHAMAEVVFSLDSLSKLNQIESEKARYAMSDFLSLYRGLMSKIKKGNSFANMLNLPVASKGDKEMPSKGGAFFRFNTIIDSASGYIITELLTNALSAKRSGVKVDDCLSCFQLNLSPWFGGTLPAGDVGLVENATSYYLEEIINNLGALWIDPEPLLDEATAENWF